MSAGNIVNVIKFKYGRSTKSYRNAPLELRVRAIFIAFARAADIGGIVNFDFGTNDVDLPAVLVSFDGVPGCNAFGFTAVEARIVADIGERVLQRPDAAPFAEPLSNFILGLRATANKAEEPDPIVNRQP